MGLDCSLQDGSGGGRIGSYGDLPHLREQVYQATLKFLEAKITSDYRHASVEITSIKPGLTDLTEIIATMEANLEKIKNIELDLHHAIICYLIIQKMQTVKLLDQKHLSLAFIMGDTTRLIFQKIELNDQNIYSILKLRLAGLDKFINHSSYEGAYSVGDCLDIVTTLDVITPYLQTNKETHVMLVKSYFQEAVDKNEALIFT